MNRFFITGMELDNTHGIIVMDGDNARHAVEVLRMSPGDALIVCDGKRTDYFCHVEKIMSKSSLELRVSERRVNGSEPETRIFLFQSLPKSDKLELIIQKAVELGVSGIYPFQSSRSVARISDNNAGKTARLMKIAESAAKQSHRGVIPEVHDASTFGHALEIAGSLGLGLILAAHEKSPVPLKELLRSKPTGRIGVFIGPEGGFSDDEIRVFDSNGIIPFSLGRRVLRTETAGLAAVANILYELED